VWPRNPHVQGDFASGIVGHYSRVVVVRNKLGIVVELANLEDLLLGVHIAVFGDADEDTDPGLVNGVQIQFRIGNSLLAAVDGCGPRPRAPAQILLLLVLQRVVAADSGYGVAQVANIVLPNAGLAVDQVIAEFLEVVPVWRC
jgi:hypothetical protein